jgi:hypothetical protein
VLSLDGGFKFVYPAGVGVGSGSPLENLAFLLGVIFPSELARDEDLGVLFPAPREGEGILLVLTSGGAGLALAAALAAFSRRIIAAIMTRFHVRGSTRNQDL